MKRAKLFSTALLLALLVAGCDSITGAEDNFVFDSIRVTYDGSMTEGAEAIGVLRNMQIDGLIILPHPCHTIEGRYGRTGGQVTLTVIANVSNAQCTAEMTAVQYRLQAFGLPRGPLRVQVYHQEAGAQRQLVAEQDIVVG
jgi:hypothetical protein